MPGRRDARRVTLQMLYLIDQNADADVYRIRQAIKEQLPQEALQEFAWTLFSGVRENIKELDVLIRDTAANWRLERMAPTDRNILRMGVYEMQHFGTPAAVVLNEAIDIAREFGTENSAAFVNGILDKLKG